MVLVTTSRSALRTERNLSYPESGRKDIHFIFLSNFGFENFHRLSNNIEMLYHQEQMHMELEKKSTSINEDKKRFELEIDGHMAIIDYILNAKGVMYLTHTEVPKELEGKGVGHKIVREALAYIDQHEYKLAPLCPFVAAFVKRNISDYRHLLADGFNVS
jgi:predicted GNAT family acetyltransferase